MKKVQGYKVRKMKGEILTARPDGMNYLEYREKRKEQQNMLRDRIRGGFMVWKSKFVPSLEAKQIKGESWGTLVGRVPQIQFTD